MSLALGHYHLEKLCFSLPILQGRLQEHEKNTLLLFVMYNIIMYVLYIARNIHVY